MSAPIPPAVVEAWLIAYSAWGDPVDDEGMAMMGEPVKRGFRAGYRHVPALLEALTKAAEWFESYAQGHWAKATAEGDAKGKANQVRAELCRKAIALATGE